MFSKFFINRPIFATVIALIMIFAGSLAVTTLPIAQYPDLTPPTVMVSASYPGANAATVARTVAEPIEEQVNGVEGMLYMSSNCSSDGSYSLTITFENGTDIDEAAVEVQNRISLADSQLPTTVTQEGVQVSKQSSNNVLFLALKGDPKLYDALYLTNYANLHITEPLSRVKGVGGVQSFGGGDYSMRVWLDPDAMRARGITPEDVSAAIQAQNMEVGAGSVGNSGNGDNAEFTFTLTSQGQLTTPEEFGNVIVKSGEGEGFLRLKDIARIELGSTSYSNSSSVNGYPVALIGVEQLPGANALEVADGALAEMSKLSKYFPEGVSYEVVMNSTDYVRESIDNVAVTFIETSLIVMAVILIFLQNWRAVIIPMITIPVSLIGTFAVMKLMGFSLNTLSLFGMVLAIAIVVDDAIVVVEDVSRLVDKGDISRKAAATKAMKELTGPVVGEVLVLLSVFIPTAFISGITGSLYKQFALTIAVATAFSGFNALTLTPALCGLFLTPRKPSKNIIYKGFDKGFNAVLHLYDKVITLMLKRPIASMLIFLGLAGVAIYGFISWPTSYIPEEDMGYFMTSIQLPTGASLDRTEKVVNALADDIRKNPYVKDVMTISGFSMMGGGASSNMGSLNVVLKPWKERGKKGSINNVIADVDKMSEKYQEAIIFSVNPPSIPGLGESSGLEMNLLDINNLGPEALQQALAAVEKEASKDTRIQAVTSLYQGVVPQYEVNFDRDRIEMMGLSMETVNSALSAYMGGSFVNDFVDFGRTFQVRLEAQGASRQEPSDILALSVRNSAGEMVPFSAIATVTPVSGQSTVSRYNMYTSASLTATPAHGVSSAEGIKIMENIVQKAVGQNYSYAWTGIAYQETQAGTTISFVFIFAIIMTILVLSAQYESWTDPIAVVLSMPIAILGTILGCIVMSQSISIYTQIGLILLLGMSAKNAILIVEYAMDFRKAGLPIMQAAHDAGVIRFRPIMMTALAFVFGVMPMMFATGAGANSRIELGTAVVFGMALNGLIGTLFVPTFWEVMQKFNEKYLTGLFKDPNAGKTGAPSSVKATAEAVAKGDVDED
ncbi:MAG: efflux RND transporter permease subunit [Muribaculaceae bacterium]|nr:efflux RND transporter permease subunit [Muribaculaceae bacterium]